MKISSSNCIITTPVKQSDDEHRLRPPSDRLTAPSPRQKELLSSIDRLHKFCHSPKLIKMEEMRLTLSLRDEIRATFADFSEDVKSWMIEMESVAVADKHYSSMIRDYIHYEFNVQKEYCFTVFILLNYLLKNSLDVDIAVYDIFSLELSSSYCRTCCISNFELSNINYAKKLLYKEQLNDQLNDSFDDRDFEVKNKAEESSDSLSTTDFLEGRINEISDEEKELINPFGSDSSVSEDCNSGFINPFDSSGSSNCDNNSPLLVPRTSSPVDNKMDKCHQCLNCKKSFHSNYNLKMHMIQFHRIFPPDTTIYECPEIDCSFVTGSRILYSRHSATHIRKGNKGIQSQQKVQCNVCNVTLANKSSLKRHCTRKHL